MNPFIAQIISQMATRDGSLQQAFTTTKSGRDGPEMVTHGGTQQQHPVAGSRPEHSLGQHPTILDRKGGPARTGPTDAEAYARSSGGLTHTTGEKGLGMAINPQAIQAIMQQMMQGGGGGGPPGGAPVPNVPGPMTPEMVMQAMQGGGGGGEPPMDPNQMQGSPADARTGQPTTEEELANVHSEMHKPDPAQMTDELRQCLESGDRKGCMQIIQEMEDANIDISKLPPDLQQELEAKGYLNGEDQGESPSQDQHDDEGDHEYR